ncbi:Abi family protein [Macrococcoides canis]|uniref:Abi family protein n=1 Tax=Macrococcoides canis TaxID=1855823 RepID=UPI0013E98EC8|nr:Abi family protein [Macrococcus canis]QIH77014.1 Abi family protein [Macrococcus canis]QUR94666.1 Abi family protein [Macrococcus canis]UTH02405.1 Abi family protein [Macrococcus canis]UTH06829.1 Abi family protein [Macrococcus canis]UTH11520.1 Abi family protein [Macrococcus canis]
MRPFKSIDEQIEILESRGLLFKDKEKARSYLLRNNYYNVVNMYSKLFQENVNKYLPNTYFEDIKALHIYDTEIKALLMKYILIAEKHFKSIFAHYFAEKYHDLQAFSYLNTSNYKTETPFEITKTLSFISKTINDQIRSSKNNSVKHNFQKHKDVPIWVIVNELSFGNIIKLYKFSDDKTRNKVAIELSTILKTNINKHIKLEPDYIDKILQNILDIRNCVAHNNKLLNFKCKNNFKYLKPLYQDTGIQPKDSRQNPFDVLIFLQCFLTTEDYSILHNSIRKRTIYMCKKIDSDIVNEIYKSYGFPKDWAKNAKKIPQIQN